jgi:capsular polysaccharide biosynthesis protein
MHHLAKVIVGPHGAGLSNILFAPPTAALVEIHPKIGNINGTQRNVCHQMTARSLGLESRMLVQESEE